jgi:Protein of unknown function (DUF3105)
VPFAISVIVAVCGWLLVQEYARLHTTSMPSLAASPNHDDQGLLPAQPGGVYRDEVAEGAWTHSLAHGYIVALVKCTSDCSTIFDQFEQLYNKDLPASVPGPVTLVVTPYSRPYLDTSKEAPITLLSWDDDLMLQQFDSERIIAFYRAHVATKTP